MRADEAPVLRTLEIRPQNGTIHGGGELALTAIGVDSNGETLDMTVAVEWSSSEPDVTVDERGHATARRVSVTATITALDPDSGVLARTTLSVAPPALKRLTISPPSAQLLVGALQAFRVTGEHVDGSREDVTRSLAWKSSKPNVVAVGSDGLATAQSIPGTATLEATDPMTGLTAFADVTVAVLEPMFITVDLKEGLRPRAAPIFPGQERQLEATGVYAGFALDLTRAVAWSSTAPDVISVDREGVATAYRAGRARIHATSEGGRVAGEIELVVAAPVLQSIELIAYSTGGGGSSDSSTLFRGQTRQFRAQGAYSDGVQRDVSQAVVWSSSPANIVAIDRRGVATAGLAAGRATITAKHAQLGISGTRTLTVLAAIMSEVELTPANFPTAGKDVAPAKGPAKDGPPPDRSLRQRDTPHGPFYYWPGTEEKVLPRLDKALKTRSEALALYRELGVQLRRRHDAEARAAKLIKAAKDVAKEVRANASKDAVIHAEDADNAKNAVNTLLLFLEDLEKRLRNAENEVRLSNQSIAIAQKRDRAAELREKGEQQEQTIRTALQVIGSVIEGTAGVLRGGAPLALALSKPAYDVITNVIQLFEKNDLVVQAERLEKEARSLELTDAAERFSHARAILAGVAESLEKARASAAVNVETYVRQRDRAEKAFDRTTRGAFRFGALADAILQCDRLVTLAPKAAQAARDAASAAFDLLGYREDLNLVPRSTQIGETLFREGNSWSETAHSLRRQTEASIKKLLTARAAAGEALVTSRTR